MEQQYMETLAYFELDEAQVKELQTEAADLHEVVDDVQTSWVDRTRATARLRDVERQIQTSRTVHRRAEQVQQPQPPRRTAPPGLIRSDCGSAYLMVDNGEPQFAEPVAY